MALLAGDALQALAFGVLARRPARATPRRACALLADAAGVRGMAGGQAIDLGSVGADAFAGRARDDAPDEDRRVDPRVGAAGRGVRPAARAPSEAAALDAYAAAAGLAFQVIDDVLDVEGSASIARQDRRQGRRAGQADVRHARWGSPQRARHAEALRDEAHAALAPFGGAARRLAELADWIVLRTH